ncbi:MAG TPA: DNA polymerase/3'-5' exonuclease PolX [Candidatus Brocadiia bacterium]|nr:DNA polymerase/3'-5' exonuclease PolX [Candidatus Brocadiia bacterium]
MKNQELAAIFAQMADVLEIQGANEFRVRSYRKIVRVLEDLPDDVETLAGDGRLEDVPGVGEGTAKKIREYLETGKIEAHQELVSQVRPETLELLNLSGVGPKTVGLLAGKLGVTSIEKLHAALDRGEIGKLPGMGEKKIENIRKALDLYSAARGRALLGWARDLADDIVGELRDRIELTEIEPAGSLRRWRETVGDLDILAVPAPRKGVDGVETARGAVKAFSSLPQFAEVLSAGETKASARTPDGFQVDLRVVPSESFGAALQYFTGSKAHNVRLRSIAQSKGLKLSEYGLFDGDRAIAGTDEEGVYEALGLPWITPELREDRGEIEAALSGKMPDLVTIKDIRCDLQSHSTFSDGSCSITEMAGFARSHGYDYYAVTDHSQSLKIANGMTPDRFLMQMQEIDGLNAKSEGFRILKGIEVDILPDGSLDMPDDVLAKADVVLASIHSNFKQSEEEMTERILKAARSPLVNIIAHPTGRLIVSREGYSVNVGRLIEECAATGTALEINSHQARLDLNDVNARRAMEAGVMLSLGTDAHHPDDFAMMPLGVSVARRAWCAPRHILNTFSCESFLEFCSRKRARR